MSYMRSMEPFSTVVASNEIYRVGRELAAVRGVFIDWCGVDMERPFPGWDRAKEVLDGRDDAAHIWQAYQQVRSFVVDVDTKTEGESPIERIKKQRDAANRAVAQFREVCISSLEKSQPDEGIVPDQTPSLPAGAIARKPSPNQRPVPVRTTLARRLPRNKPAA